jgi:hypothetical protein
VPHWMRPDGHNCTFFVCCGLVYFPPKRYAGGWVLGVTWPLLVNLRVDFIFSQKEEVDIMESRRS